MQSNAYTLDRSLACSLFRGFHFDLFGTAFNTLATSYPCGTSYVRRTLSALPPAPSLCVAIPPWSHLLSLLQEAQGNLPAQVALVVPFWPAQPWFPLLQSLHTGRVWLLPGRPWRAPRNCRQRPWRALLLLVGRWPTPSPYFRKLCLLGCKPLAIIDSYNVRG